MIVRVLIICWAYQVPTDSWQDGLPMRLVTFDDGRVGYLAKDRVVDLGDLVGGYGHPGTISAMRRLLADWGTPREQLPTATAANSVALSSVRLGPPVPDPTKIVAAPVNYRDPTTSTWTARSAASTASPATPRTSSGEWPSWSPTSPR
jgi:hypothetical protein